MDRVAVHGQRRLHDRLAEGRVRVDVAAELPRVALEQLRQCRLGDELCRVGSDDMRAEHLARLGVGNDLDEAASLTVDDRPAQRREGKAADPHLVSKLLTDGVFILNRRVSLEMTDNCSPCDISLSYIEINIQKNPPSGCSAFTPLPKLRLNGANAAYCHLILTGPPVLDYDLGNPTSGFPEGNTNFCTFKVIVLPGTAPQLTVLRSGTSDKDRLASLPLIRVFASQCL